jgi:hemerythrin
MALMNWTNDFSVNIKEIDEQHKKLMAMINDLHAAMLAGKAKEAIGPILNGLIDYTKTHFAMEEQLMTKHQYTGYLSHKAAHDALTKQVMDLKTKFSEGKALVTMDIMTFLKDWLTKHIQETDKKYGPFFNGKGIV